MAARLTRPLYVRYDVRTGKTLVPRPVTVPSNGGSAGRVSEQRAGAETREQMAPAPPAKTMDDRAIKVARDDSVIVRARADSALAPPARSLGESSIKVTRSEKTPGQTLANTPPAPPAKSVGDNAIKVTRGEGDNAEPRLSTPPVSQTRSSTGPIKVTRDENPASARTNAAAPAPAQARNDRPAPSPEAAAAPATAQTLDDPFTDDLSIKSAGGDKITSEAPRDADPSPHAKAPNDRMARLMLHDKIVIEELEREPRFPIPKPRKRRERDDDYISDRTIIVITGAVIATAFAFTFMLPSLLTRDPVDTSVELVNTGTPIQRAAQTQQTQIQQTQQVAAPRPAPEPLPAAPPPAPAPAPAPATQDTATASVEQSVPALRGSAPAQAQVDRGATREVLVPAARAAGRTTLTAAEMEAVNRGLQELAKAAPTKAPPRTAAPARAVAPTRTAATRPGLSAEEKAAIERGLRELEKSQQGNP